jgi:protocatechuate 3,4-dioxygenase beta subunit
MLSVLALCLTNRPIQAQTAAPKPGTATISGRVLLKGEPAPDVAVVLQPLPVVFPQNPDAVLRVRTDSSGRFHLAAVVAGRYSIWAFSPGAISPNDTSFGPIPGKPLNVSDGENVENIDLPLKPGGVITGRVTDASGRPLVDERLELTRLDREGKPQPNYGSPYTYEMYGTDDRGVYRLYGLSEGRYRISVGFAQTPGSISIVNSRSYYPKTYYPDARDESQAKVIEVTEGFEATNIDIKVGESKRSYDIYGRVVDADSGQPVAGASISYGAFIGGRISSWGSNGTRSGANGEFHMIGVLPGQYGVFVPSESDNDFYSEPVTCDVNEGDVQGVEIKVRQGGSISGVVVIEGANDPKIISRLSQLNLRAFMRPNQGSMTPIMGGGLIRPNPDGSFRIRGLQAGKVELTIGQTPGLAFSRVEVNGAPQREGIEVNSGESVTGVKMVLTRASLSLRGELKLIGVAVPAGVRLIAVARRTDQSTRSQPSSSAEVDARGQFVIENLAPGEYEVRVSLGFTPNTTDSPAPELMRAFSMATQRVTLSGDNQTPITLIVKEENQ